MMTKIRIPASQIATFKAFAKAFSVIIQEEAGVRLRGRHLLNLFARAAGHNGYNALVYDTHAYGDGRFAWSDVLAALAEGISAELSLDRMAVLVMLGNATHKVPGLTVSISSEAAGAHNPFKGFKPNLTTLPKLGINIWADMSRSYLNSLAVTGAGRSQIELAKTDTSDLIDAGDEVARAVFANANTSLAIGLPDNNSDAPYLVLRSDSGLSSEDEQSLAENLNQSRPGSLLLTMEGIGTDELPPDENLGAPADQTKNAAIQVNHVAFLDQAPMPWVGDQLRQVLDSGSGKK